MTLDDALNRIAELKQRVAELEDNMLVQGWCPKCNARWCVCEHASENEARRSKLFEIDDEREIKDMINAQKARQG